ncbi:protein of unknown function [Candidatus Methylocalor cossyra]|uniref:Uncharacterized protein n=1 Tax=Candidatus Methylocalor cossyra TaxID=3108543 RepID=A0ABP1C5K1_9GAMM
MAGLNLRPGTVAINLWVIDNGPPGGQSLAPSTTAKGTGGEHPKAFRRDGSVGDGGMPFRYLS